MRLLVLFVVIIIAAADAEIPEIFDSRVAWPECAEIAGAIPDQAAELCEGACWAFASALSVSARLCIADRNFAIPPSPSAALVYTPWCGGCDGGFAKCLLGEWVDAGWWSSPAENFEVCEFCRLRGVQEFRRDPGAAALAILRGGPCVSDVLLTREFYERGNFSAEDFLRCSSAGILQPARKHSVRILGWDVDGTSGAREWIVASSWGKFWGSRKDPGTFRVPFGNNDCDLEREIICAIV